MHASILNIIVNALLSAFKFAAGILGHSSAILSDAVDSAADVLSAAIVSVGVTVAGKKSDAAHPYGHERMECLVSVLLAAGLFLTGAGIGISGVQRIWVLLSGQTTAEQMQLPTLLPVIAAVVSIAVKLWMFCYTRAVGRRLNSSALLASALNYRNDALSSLGVLIGVAGARFGMPVLDPVVSVLICLLIMKSAYSICKNAVDQMVDRSCDSETTEKIRQLVLLTDGVRGVDLLMTRMFGSKFYVDIEIALDGNQTLYEAHAVAEAVHDRVEENFPFAKHCMVHMNPYPPLENQPD